MSVGSDFVKSDMKSPPTARAVAVVELLVSAAHPVHIGEITRRLGLNRSTCGKILDTLESMHWVESNGTRLYQPGAGLIPVANAVRARMPILRDAAPVMRRLLQRLGVEAVSLSSLDDGFLTLVETVHRNPDVDAQPTFRLPVVPPFGAAMVAFFSAADRERWLVGVADRTVREHLAENIESIRRHGVAVWRFDRAGHAMQRALAASDAFGTGRARGRPDAGVGGPMTALELGLGRMGYTSAEMRPSAAPFAVGYLAAAVFDASDQPCFSLEPHILRTDVSVDRLQDLVGALREGADELTALGGGDPSRFGWTPLNSSG
jgi:DNA-binding IclR family transcriptional regulator